MKNSVSEMPIPTAPLANITTRSCGAAGSVSVCPSPAAVTPSSTKAMQFLNRFKANGRTRPTALLNRITATAQSRAVRRAKNSPMATLLRQLTNRGESEFGGIAGGSVHEPAVAVFGLAVRTICDAPDDDHRNTKPRAHQRHGRSFHFHGARVQFTAELGAV